MGVLDLNVTEMGEDPCDEGEHDWCQTGSGMVRCVKPGCKSIGS